MQKKKDYLAIFDLDGTLFDTSEVNYLAYRDAMAVFGAHLDKDYFVNQCNGRHYKEFVPVVMGTEEHMEEVHKLKKDFYAKHLKSAKANLHLFQIIKSLREQYYVAIVTTASKKNTNDILGYFGYGQLFDYVVTQELITRTKPDPQGFNIAIEHFNMDPSRTIIFEDSEVGIAAAKATGASVMIVGQF